MSQATRPTLDGSHWRRGGLLGPIGAMALVWMLAGCSSGGGPLVPLDPGVDAASVSPVDGAGEETVEGGCVTDVDCQDSESPLGSCQVASCSAETGLCVTGQVPDGGDCDDGDPCTIGTSCASGSCEGGEARVCEEDGDVCTDAVCQPDSGCAQVHNEASCDDADPCTLEDQCAAGVCLGTPKSCPSAVEGEVCICAPETGECSCGVGCEVAGDCADQNPCSVDSCVDGFCAYEVIEECCIASSECADGDLCTEDICDEGVCDNEPIPGCCVQPLDCEDGNPCTSHACPDNQCLSTVIEGCCVDEDDCDDKLPCTEDTCEAMTCVHTDKPACCVVEAECDDGDACTTDQCENALCVNTAIEGCCVTAEDCEDDSVCTDHACEAGVCALIPVPGCCINNVQCEDYNPCTVDVCDENSCLNIPGTSECCEVDSDCEDDDPCTKNDCHPVGGYCVYTTLCCSEDGDCDDDKFCTQDTCEAGVCSYDLQEGCCKATFDCDDDNPCTEDICDDDTGCVNDGPAVNLLSCDDGDPCTASAVCLEGACTPSVSMSCDDGNPCTADACDSSTGQCVSPEVAGCCYTDATCDDQDLCTSEACVSQSCQGVVIGSRCLQVVSEPGTWFEGEAKCQALGGHLVSLLSEADQMGVMSQMSQSACATSWIGANDLTSESAFQWSDGTSLGYEAWADGQPTDCLDCCAVPGGQDAALLDDQGAWKSACALEEAPCFACAVDHAPGICETTPNVSCCYVDADCNDGNPCTKDLCADGADPQFPEPGCVHWATPLAGEPCDDGDACTEGGLCNEVAWNEGECVAQDVSCDDLDPCTVDTCDPETGCVFTPDCTPPCNPAACE
ncbi:MAG: C-type lectin domain-containing protein [Myxococcota bacterium]|nr:C-type lectin domain-containing protein [Myxococcota bacterium]